MTGEVKEPSDSDKKEYDRQMVNRQIQNLFTSKGINTSQLEQYNMSFNIDPFNDSLSVSGITDDGLADQIEQILNFGNNSKKFFFHILGSNSSNFSEDTMLKYRVLKDFQRITGENLRNYRQTDKGMVDNKVRNVLNVYEEALKTSKVVPAEYKSDAYDYFKSNVEKLLNKDILGIPDMNLSIGYVNGLLQDQSNENIMKATFDASI